MIVADNNAGRKFFQRRLKNDFIVHQGTRYAALAYFYMAGNYIGPVQQQYIKLFMGLVSQVWIQVFESVFAAGDLFWLLLVREFAPPAQLKGCDYSYRFGGAYTFYRT